MKTIVRSLALCVGAFALALASPQAQATPLPPGGTAVPNAQADPLAGTIILQDTGAQPYSATLGSQTLAGTGEAWVVTNYASNPFGPGDLTFVYQVSLSAASSAGETIQRLTMSKFDAFSTDVGYFQQNGAQVIPPSTDRFTGDVVGVNYTTTPIPIGSTTALIIINTNAIFFTDGALSVQDGLTANLAAFQPSAVAIAPEPATFAMALTAVPFLGIAAWRRYRRKAT